MKRLFLCRHAHAGESDKGDFYRALTREGVAEAETMAARMAVRQLQADLIFASPARRALQTATIFADALGYESDRIITEMSIYEQDNRSIIGFLRHVCHDAENVWIFGHNPSFQELAATLTGLPEHRNPPGTVVAIEFDAPGWGLALGTAGNLIFREIL